MRAVKALRQWVVTIGRGFYARGTPMIKSRSILLLVGGAYLVVIIGLAAWMDRRLRTVSANAFAASVHRIGREIASALAASPGSILPTDNAARLQLKALVAELTGRSELVQSIDVVKRDGTILASDDRALVGTRTRSVADVLGSNDEVKLREPRRALAPEAVYELIVPLVRDEEVAGYLRLAIANAAMSRFIAHQRTQLAIVGAIGFVALVLLTLVLQQQFYRHGTAVARTIEGVLSGTVALPPVRDAAFSRVFEAAGRLAGQLRERGNDASNREMAVQAAGLSRIHSALAHELRAPLHAMVLNVELLERALDRAEESRIRDSARYVRVIKAEIDRLQRAVVALGADGAAAEWQSVDLAEIIRGVGDLMAPSAAAQGIAVEIDTRVAAPVMGFRDRLRQVILNLANNAIDAMPDGGRLRISVGAEENAWVVSVADTGVGFSADTLAHLSDGPVSTKASGKGIGLYLARAIIEAHGGRIRVASTEGKGTCCEIELPCARGSA